MLLSRYLKSRFKAAIRSIAAHLDDSGPNNRRTAAVALTAVSVAPETVAVLDFSDTHSEVMASSVHYFLELGYNVDAFVNAASAAGDGLVGMDFPADRVRFFTMPDSQMWKDEIFMLNLLRYDWLFLNTASLWSETYHLAIEFYNRFERRFYRNNVRYIIHDIEGESVPWPLDLRDRFVSKSFAISRFTAFGKPFPFLSPTFFGSFAVPYVQNEKTRFFIAGSILNSKRVARNLGGIIDDLCKLAESAKTTRIDFEIVVCGRREGEADLDFPDILRSYVRFLGQLTYPQMYRALQSSKFIISGLDADLAPEYVRSRASGNFGLSIGFSRPMILQDRIAAAHGFDATNAILHTGASCLDALRHCIEMPEKEYWNLVGGLSLLREKNQAETMDTMSKVFGRVSR